MTATENFPDPWLARDYRAEHDKRAKALHKLSMPALREIERRLLAEAGTERIWGGPYSKDEFERAILDLEFPPALMNEASHAAHHNEGETWSACEFCHPHQGSTCQCSLGKKEATP